MIESLKSSATLKQKIEFSESGFQKANKKQWKPRTPTARFVAKNSTNQLYPKLRVNSAIVITRHVKHVLEHIF